MKKQVTAIICVILSVWFFFMGFELGSYREKKNFKASQTQVFQPMSQTNYNSQSSSVPIDQTQPTVTSSTEATVPSEPLTAYTESTAGQTTAPTTRPAADPASMSKAEVIAAAKKAIDAVKSEQNMTAVQTENIKITVNDCSVPSLTSIVNGIVQRFTGEKSATYKFVNGQATGVRPDGKEVEDEGVVSPTQVIPPKDRTFDITEAGVTEASAKKSGTDTVYTIRIKEESTTLQNPVPPFNASAIGYLDLSKISDKINGAEITEANMHYPGSSVVATVNAAGKLVKLELNLPMDGYGAASLKVLKGNASFSGSMLETWSFTY